MPRHDWFPENLDPATYDPARSARGAMKPALPKRFYKTAMAGEAEGEFRLLLDGRPARTPARKLLALPTRAAADLLAAEWEAQHELIDPGLMPVTRMANAALDHVAEKMAEVRADIARYARSDLLFYRVEEPARLVERQAALWDPVLDWAAEHFGARFILTQGIRYVDQPDIAVARVVSVLEEITNPVALAALHVMTVLSGSVLLALAVAHRHSDAGVAFAAAELDADTQRELWGADEEAEAARAHRERDMKAAAALYLSL